MKNITYVISLLSLPFFVYAQQITLDGGDVVFEVPSEYKVVSRYEVNITMPLEIMLGNIIGDKPLDIVMAYGIVQQSLSEKMSTEIIKQLSGVSPDLKWTKKNKVHISGQDWMLITGVMLAPFRETRKIFMSTEYKGKTLVLYIEIRGNNPKIHRREVQHIIQSIELFGKSYHWRLDTTVNDSNITNYSISYTRGNDAKSLSDCLSVINKYFAIRIMLPMSDPELQDELISYYKDTIPSAYKRALDSKRGIHNAVNKPLIDSFPDAFRKTTIYKELENFLELKGYLVKQKISFEKFDIYSSGKDDFIHADIWLHAIPYGNLVGVMERYFDNKTIKQFARDGFWSPCYNALIVYLGNDKIYAFVKNKSDKYVAVDISIVAQKNIGKLGPNRKYTKVKTRAVEWKQCRGAYSVLMETKAWVGNQRYRVTQVLIIDADGVVKWR